MDPRPPKFHRSHLRQPRRRWPFALSILANLLLAVLFARVLVPLFERAQTPTPSPAGIEWQWLEPAQAGQEAAPAREQSPARQIVSNRRANNQEPENARYLAERSARTEKEMVGPRGAPPPGTAASKPAGPSGPSQAEEDEDEDDAGDAPQERAPARVGPEPIFPSGEQIARLLSQRQRQREERRAEGAGESGGMPEAEPLPLAAGEGMDLLDPSIEQGPFTLLNQKSFRYAGFLNRVFERVYAHYLRRLYSQGTYSFLTPGDDGEAVIETILDRRGEQLSTRIVEFRGSATLAETGRHAMEQGAWDLNPPAGIEAEDGYIHFVLIARVGYRGLSRTYNPRYQGFIRFGVL